LTLIYYYIYLAQKNKVKYHVSQFFSLINTLPRILTRIAATIASGIPWIKATDAAAAKGRYPLKTASPRTVTVLKTVQIKPVIIKLKFKLIFLVLIKT